MSGLAASTISSVHRQHLPPMEMLLRRGLIETCPPHLRVEDYAGSTYDQLTRDSMSRIVDGHWSSEPGANSYRSANLVGHFPSHSPITADVYRESRDIFFDRFSQVFSSLVTPPKTFIDFHVDTSSPTKMMRHAALWKLALAHEMIGDSSAIFTRSSLSSRSRLPGDDFQSTASFIEPVDVDRSMEEMSGCSERGEMARPSMPMDISVAVVHLAKLESHRVEDDASGRAWKLPKILYQVAITDEYARNLKKRRTL
ncbi:uncharacterized protein RCO7_08953 [Rhynchosporium graminicola]|uniref:Uncharacterized protein n=1 Tax=Rhynchosporium graminicola TaxID=2792576 RepID=A0A1E1KJU3_9HELO|nr:uncharacterized protein RCO7_08953 [Rhynchosporium commune]